MHIHNLLRRLRIKVKGTGSPTKHLCSNCSDDRQYMESGVFGLNRKMLPSRDFLDWDFKLHKKAIILHSKKIVGILLDISQDSFHSERTLDNSGSENSIMSEMMSENHSNMEGAV